MIRVLESVLLLAAIGAGLAPVTALAHQQSAGAKGIPNACTLLPREDVRKLLPWPAFVDAVTTLEEERVSGGSACEYPSVRIQILPLSQSLLDSERKKPQVESVAGVGDDAFFVPRVRQFAEMYVKAGSHMLMLQAGVPTGQTVDTMKPAVTSLARALVEKLR